MAGELAGENQVLLVHEHAQLQGLDMRHDREQIEDYDSKRRRREVAASDS